MSATELPPGPWRWEQVDPGTLERRRHPGADRHDDHVARPDVGPRGWGLIGADGQAVLLHDAGWGSIDLGDDLGFRPDHPIAVLLARAWEIPCLEAALAELQRDLAEARASRRTAEEVVVRQKALLETATELIENARRWARSLWDDGPASQEPVVLNEPEIAPAWLTAAGPRHTARPPQTRTGAEPAEAAHQLKLAAIDRLIADVEEEWGPITAEEMATAAQRLRDRAAPPR